MVHQAGVLVCHQLPIRNLKVRQTWALHPQGVLDLPWDHLAQCQGLQLLHHKCHPGQMAHPCPVVVHPCPQEFNSLQCPVGLNSLQCSVGLSILQCLEDLVSLQCLEDRSLRSPCLLVLQWECSTSNLQCLLEGHHHLCLLMVLLVDYKHHRGQEEAYLDNPHYQANYLDNLPYQDNHLYLVTMVPVSLLLE